MSTFEPLEFVKPHKETLLAMYEQETTRNNEQPSHSRLKTSVRLHIDQTIRTRNFRTRNEIVERRPVTKSQKGKKATAERKVGECYQWNPNLTMFAVSVTIPHQETGARGEKNKSSRAPKADTLQKFK